MFGAIFTWGVQRSETGFAREGESMPRVVDMKAAAAEFMAMTLFVIVGCGVACGNGAFDAASRYLVASTFGMGILVLAYATGHHSGGQINCAVTLSLVLGGQVPWFQGLANFVAQMAGSLCGSIVLAMIFPCSEDMTTNLGTNIVNPKYGFFAAILGEIFMTFLLCYVVWETAVTARCGQAACIPIGFAVFLAHVFLLPIDGCSINPTRSFGPAIISGMRGCKNSTPGLGHLWVMWMGPLIGGALAALVQVAFVHHVHAISVIKEVGSGQRKWAELQEEDQAPA